MAMTKRLWSINALAVEFGMDRRTVALRIQNIPPAGEEKGNAVWNLAEVAHVLAPKRPVPVPSARTVPSLPPGFEFLKHIHNPADAAAAFMAVAMIYRIGRLTASMAVACGIPCHLAYLLKDNITLALMMEVEEFGTQCGFEPFASTAEPEIYEVEAFEEVDWKALADLAGEPFDLEGWKAHARQWAQEQDVAPIAAE